MVRWHVAFSATIATGLASRSYPVAWFVWDRVVGEVLHAVAA
jgi:hypothetical protein